LYDDVDVLRNRGNIRKAETLRKAEGDVTKHTMAFVYTHGFTKFNTKTLREIHRLIFDSLFDWAGEFRTIPLIKHEEILGGDAMRYAYPKAIKKELDEASKEIAQLKKTQDKRDLLFKLVRIFAKIWQTHPFREGNTRTIMAFIVLLASHLHIEIDYSLFEKHAAYVRNALVWASQGMYSKFEYLEHIFFDAGGLDAHAAAMNQSAAKDYSVIEGYKVADYKEQPHTYADDETECEETRERKRALLSL
jgi:cell filamentation protein